MNRLATKARFSLGFPATSEAGVKYLRQPMLAAFCRTWKGVRMDQTAGALTDVLVLHEYERHGFGGERGSIGQEPIGSEAQCSSPHPIRLG